MTLDQARQHGAEWADHNYSEGSLPEDDAADMRQCWRATCRHEGIDGTQECWWAFTDAYRSHMHENRNKE